MRNEHTAEHFDSHAEAQQSRQAANLSCAAQDCFEPVMSARPAQQPGFLDFSIGQIYGQETFGAAEANQRFRGAAEDSGFVFDYEPRELVKGRSFALGMDYETKPDMRTVGEKFWDFAAAAAKNASNVDNYTGYAHSETEKLLGAAEGMNMAKDETKAMFAAGWKAVTDGSLAKALSNPGAILEPVARTTGDAVNAMSRDAHAADKAIGHAALALTGALVTANEEYNKLSDRDKGHVIGHAAFALINPEGSTKSGEAALKIADTVATHVDSAVMKTIEQSIKVIDDLAKTAPEVAQETKQMLYDYLKGKGLNGPEFEAAGIPRGFFDDVAADKSEHYFAMAKDGDKARRGSKHVVEVGGEKIEYTFDKSSGRLQRTDRGKIRESYGWPVLNERFDPTVTRQTYLDSCIAAVAEVLTEGKVKEATWIDKLGRPGDLKNLAKHLGDEWTHVRGVNLDEILERGPFVAHMYEGMWVPMIGRKPPHAVLVTGQTSCGNLIIKDPQEGTIYEMTRDAFLDTWTKNTVYRKNPM